MNQTVTKQAAKQIRRAFGPAAADALAIDGQRLRFCAGILRRGLFGRLKWLLFGR